VGLIKFSGRHAELFNSNRVQRIMIVDAAGIESDRIDITLHCENLSGGPARDEKINAAWVLESGELDLGRYLITRVQFSGAPFKSVITASKAPYTLKNETEFDKRRSQSYENMTLKALVEFIAARHGFEARVDPELGLEQFDYIDQSDESDPAFLMRLARMRDAIAKPVMDKNPLYIFCKRGREKSFSGKSMKPISLSYTKDKISRFSYDEPGRSGLSGVEVIYVDAETQQEKTLQVGSAPLKKFAHKFQHEAQARGFAESQLKNLTRMQKTVMIGMHLKPEIFAESRISLGDDWPEALRGNWVVNRATHDVHGRTTDITLVSL